MLKIFFGKHKIADEERIRYGEDHKAAVQSVIQRCKQEYILEEFIRIHESEVRRMLGEIFSEEYANEVMLRSKERERLYELNEAEKRGIELGEKKAVIEMVKTMIKNNAGVEEISRFTGITVEEIRKIAEKTE